MNPAYFVSKNEILQWINNLLMLKVEKIEHLGSGAVYCQILDAIFPGKVALSKVTWNAKTPYEKLQNFKILTNALHKLKINKHLEVQRLTQCKYQDNLELCQWFKQFYESNANPNIRYDA